jgi:hypothetical protein
MALHQIHFPAIELSLLLFHFRNDGGLIMVDLHKKAVLIPTNSFLIEINDVFSTSILFVFSKLYTQPKSWQQNEAKSPVV